MARPKKRGLDYFPLDVNVFDDDKLFDVQNEYGPLGETVYLRLICLVYKNGYYFKFDSIEKLAALVIRSIGSRWIESKREVVEIIEFMVECGLFSGLMFENNILTSKGIQSRYKLATERRRSGIAEYCLIDNTSNDNENIHSSKITQGLRDFNVGENTDINEYNNNSQENISGYSNIRISETGNIVFENKFGEHNMSFSDEKNVHGDKFTYSEMLVGENNLFNNNNFNNGYDLGEFNIYNYLNDVTDSTKMACEKENVHERVSADNNQIFCCNNPTKKSKTDKSKVNRKAEESESIPDTAVGECSGSSEKNIVNIFNSICLSLPKVTKLTDKRIYAVRNAAARINGDFEGLFRRVESSDFLTGRNGKWFNCSFDWIFKPSNLVKILNGNYDNNELAKGRYTGCNYRSEVQDRAYCESLKNLAMID